MFDTPLPRFLYKTQFFIYKTPVFHIENPTFCIKDIRLQAMAIAIPTTGMHAGTDI